MSNIYYKHVRPSMTSWGPEENPFDMTLAGKVDGDHVKIGIGVCSHSDQFSKKDGRIEAIERLTYYPIYSFPIMHKREFRAVHYWFNVINVMVSNDSKLIKNFVVRKQQAFERTEFGIRRKMQRQRERVEVKEALKRKKVEEKLAYLANRLKIKP